MLLPKEHPPNFFEMFLCFLPTRAPQNKRFDNSLPRRLDFFEITCTVYAACPSGHPCALRALRLTTEKCFAFFLLCLISSKSSTMALSFLSFPKLFPPIKTAADIITYLRHQNQITRILYPNPWAFYILRFILSH